MSTRRRKMTGSEEASTGRSSHKSKRAGHLDDSSGDGAGSFEAESDQLCPVREELPGVDLSVVLPSPIPHVGQSGVQELLHEGSIQDVEGFIASREDPICKVQEAEKIIQVQQALGLNFDSQDQLPTDKLVSMEDRD
ncbi:hypothetical protein A2U01_0039119, partial [Trifolium medium]|nr:hypothetical protein [Trifolium medium]